MGNKTRIQKMTILSMFIAIELIMAMTPIGYLSLGAISITTMHIPVIFAGILLGPTEGAILGFVFGMTSFLKATFAPTITSFCFSPFYSVGDIHGNFWSLLIAFAPRILLGYLSGLLYNAFKKAKKNNFVVESLIAIGMTLLHTLMVMGLIWLFFGQVYASVTGLAVSTVIIPVITSNGILEMIVAGIIIPTMMRVLRPVLDKLELGKSAHA